MARLKSEVVMFDEEEYAELMRHYLEPVVVQNAELAMGQRLRRQTVAAATHPAGWSRLARAAQASGSAA